MLGPGTPRAAGPAAAAAPGPRLLRPLQGDLHADLLRVITRKFGGSAKAWLAAIGSRVAAGDAASAQAWLERATGALPQRKHVKARALVAAGSGCPQRCHNGCGVQVLSQTAVAYFRAGLQEQGRSILDSVLRSYPKRLDLWFLYADQARRQPTPVPEPGAVLELGAGRRRPSGERRPGSGPCLSAGPTPTCRRARCSAGKGRRCCTPAVLAECAAACADEDHVQALARL